MKRGDLGCKKEVCDLFKVYCNNEILTKRLTRDHNLVKYGPCVLRDWDLKASILNNDQLV